MYPMQAWALAALEDARQRLRAEVWSLEVPPSSLASKLLIAIAEDPAAFRLARVADAHSIGRSTLSSRWDRLQLPNLIVLRDLARAHSVASLLQHPDMSASFAAISAGEACSNKLWRMLKRRGLAVTNLRASSAPRHTLRDWHELLQLHRAGFAALPEPAVHRPPSIQARVLRAEIIEVERRLAGLRDQLRRSA